MLATRVIPCLLLREGALVKTVKFKDASYIGDPTNAIKIYNEKEVDELLVLDVTATVDGRDPPFRAIEQFASECFMPVAYGGGVRRLEDAREILRLGIEKIVVNSAAVERSEFVREAAEQFGAQAIVVSIDARRRHDGSYEVFTHGGRRASGLDPRAFAGAMQETGAGEILLTSIDRDGTMGGYDLDLIRLVSQAVDVPVIACGGAGKISDFAAAVKVGGASAVAAGSMVVYFGRNRAVLINFPSRRELERALA